MPIKRCDRDCYGPNSLQDNAVRTGHGHHSATKVLFSLALNGMDARKHTLNKRAGTS